MRSRQLLPPFALTIRPSRYWLVLLSGLLLLSAVSVLRYVEDLWWLLPLQCVLGWLALRGNGWWWRSSLQGIAVDSLGRMHWHYADRSLVVSPADDCFISPFLIIVNVMAAGRRHSCLLLPDSAEAEALRQLRVYLLWFHAGVETDPSAVVEHP
jgi:toxin CptA